MFFVVPAHGIDRLINALPTIAAGLALLALIVSLLPVLFTRVVEVVAAVAALLVVVGAGVNVRVRYDDSLDFRAAYWVALLSAAALVVVAVIDFTRSRPQERLVD